MSFPGVKKPIEAPVGDQKSEFAPRFPAGARDSREARSRIRCRSSRRPPGARSPTPRGSGELAEDTNEICVRRGETASRGLDVREGAVPEAGAANWTALAGGGRLRGLAQ